MRSMIVWWLLAGAEHLNESEFPTDCWSSTFNCWVVAPGLGEGVGKTRLYRRRGMRSTPPENFAPGARESSTTPCTEDSAARTRSIAPERVISTSTLPPASGM